jgi:hypothetical protein
MPFRPKVVLPDDPPLSGDGDLALPDELAALAAQLQDDARMLAETYLKPQPTRFADATTPLLSRRLVYIAISSALVASVLIAVIGLGTLASNPSSTKPSAAQVATRRGNEHDPPGVARPAPSTGAQTSRSFISLTELSGPELEAVWDLWEGGGDGISTGISF